MDVSRDGALLSPQEEWQNSGQLGSLHPLALFPLSPVPLPPPYCLQQVQVHIVDNAICEQLYHNATGHHHQSHRFIQDDMLCAGSKGQGICNVSLIDFPFLVPIPTSRPTPTGASSSSRVTQVAPWSAG